MQQDIKLWIKLKEFFFCFSYFFSLSDLESASDGDTWSGITERLSELLWTKCSFFFLRRRGAGGFLGVKHSSTAQRDTHSSCQDNLWVSSAQTGDRGPPAVLQGPNCWSHSSDHFLRSLSFQNQRSNNIS